MRPHTGDPTHRTTPVWLSDLTLLCARLHRSWQLGSSDTHHWIRLGSSSRRHIHSPGRTPSLGSMGKEGGVSTPFPLKPAHMQPQRVCLRHNSQGSDPIEDCCELQDSMQPPEHCRLSHQCTARRDHSLIQNAKPLNPYIQPSSSSSRP